MSNPEDAALLKEAESWRRGGLCRDPEVILSALAQSLRAALAREAEMRKEHNRAYAELLGHSVEQEQRAEAAEAEVTRLKTEMARLAEVWLASPEAAKRFEGYRELGQKCAELEYEVTRLSSLLAQRENQEPTP